MLGARLALVTVDSDPSYPDVGTMTCLVRTSGEMGVELFEAANKIDPVFPEPPVAPRKLSFLKLDFSLLLRQHRACLSVTAQLRQLGFIGKWFLPGNRRSVIFTEPRLRKASRASCYAGAAAERAKPPHSTRRHFLPSEIRFCVEKTDVSGAWLVNHYDS